jgi:hypothetical protein
MMTRRQEYALICQLAIGATLAVAMAMLAACYAPPRERIVTTTTTEEATPTVVTLRPPPVREEIVPAAPSERVTWHPGHWSWDGTGYVWVTGHWVDRPYANAMWEPGHWVDRGNGWVWEEGHWRA